MRYILFLVVLIFQIVYTCNNFCNGHGKCEIRDKCSCFPGWGGADCSLRACPYGEAFVDQILGDLNHNGRLDDTDVKTEWYPKAGLSETLTNDVITKRAHRYAECSNNGLCNRRRGECECFPGYEGSSCQRRSCPTVLNGKSCSGHGICLSSEAYIEEKTAATEGSTSNKVTGWELDKFYTCKCDQGWEGITCSSRVCPKAVDPVTFGKIKTDYYFPLNNNNVKSHYYKITYDGIIYYSDDFIEKVITDNSENLCKDNKLVDFRDINTAELIQEEIRLSFSKIPPLSNAVIEITCDDNGNSKKSATIHIKPEFIDITKLKHFQTPNTVDIELHSINDNDDVIKASYRYENSNGETVEVEDILKSQNTCANRGLCNGMTGLCECFAGYYGTSCENLRSLAI